MSGDGRPKAASPLRLPPFYLVVPTAMAVVAIPYCGLLWWCAIAFLPLAVASSSMVASCLWRARLVARSACWGVQHFVDMMLQLFLVAVALFVDKGMRLVDMMMQLFLVAVALFRGQGGRAPRARPSVAAAGTRAVARLLLGESRASVGSSCGVLLSPSASRWPSVAQHRHLRSFSSSG